MSDSWEAPKKAEGDITFGSALGMTLEEANIEKLFNKKHITGISSEICFRRMGTIFKDGEIILKDKKEFFLTLSIRSEYIEMVESCVAGVNDKFKYFTCEVFKVIGAEILSPVQRSYSLIQCYKKNDKKPSHYIIVLKMYIPKEHNKEIKSSTFYVLCAFISILFRHFSSREQKGNSSVRVNRILEHNPRDFEGLCELNTIIKKDYGSGHSITKEVEVKDILCFESDEVADECVSTQFGYINPSSWLTASKIRTRIKESSVE